jgi:ankyrin repeat protein
MDFKIIHSLVDTLRDKGEHHTYTSLRNSKGESPLHWAAYFNDIPFAKKYYYITSQPYSRNFDELNNTPLNWAIDNNHFEIAKILIENGLNVNARDTNGYTVLMQAVIKDSIEVVKAIFQYGKNLTNNLKTPKHELTALHLVAQLNRKDIAQFLKNTSENFMGITKSEKNPLHYAANFGSFEVAVQLIDEDYTNDKNQKDINGNTPLHYCVKPWTNNSNLPTAIGDPNHIYTYAKIAKLFLAAGADPNKMNKEGKTPFELVDKTDSNALKVWSEVLRGK